MSQTDPPNVPTVALEDIQKGWHDITLRVAQLEAERAVLSHENKELRSLLERIVEHRQKSHGELINLLSGLVSRLPINDIGVVVSRLMEHNAHVAEVCAALARGRVEATQIQPQMLRVLDQTKRDLRAAIEPAVKELLQLDAPLEPALLQGLVTDPDSYASPAFIRASRCFIKGQVPRERVLREFGEGALAFFSDMTTDPKLNPRPKPDDIVMAFAPNFEVTLQQNPEAIPDKRQSLLALHQRVQRSKTPTTEARAQKNAFLRLAFILELLHYYENQNTESPEVVFAQRLPPVLEQIVAPSPLDNLDDRLVAQAEALLAFIINTDHRLSVINNMGKAGGTARSARFVLRLRADKAPTENQSILHEVIPDFVKHLLTPPPQKPEQQQVVAAVLRFLSTELQKVVIKGIVHSDRLRKEEADSLTKALAKDLNLSGWEDAGKAASALTPEMERKLAWDKVGDLIAKRADPGEVAHAIRERLHAKYDSDEVKESWLTLIEADPITLIRAFCQLPYLPDGRTDSIAQPVLESYVVRLTHEKYAATYHKVVTSLKNMFKARPDSPTLVNFLALVRWADADAAAKLGADIGLPPQGRPA